VLYRFDEFELDTQLYELRRDGEVCPLERQVFDVLAYLVEHQDRVVPKSELLDQVWGSRFVSDATLSSRIMSARRALGDSGKQQRFIQTVQGRGFRFVGGASSETSAARSTAPPLPRPAATRQEQHIRFCKAADGVRIAYATIGAGPPLVKAANWLSHLEFDWRSPIWRHWIEELARDHLFVKYDERGSGLSDRDVADCSFESWVNDLESVIDALGFERVALLGVSQGGPVAISYAVRHPDRVSHLVLYGTYAQGWGVRPQDPPALREEREAQMTLTRLGWGRDNPAYRNMFTMSFIPEATADEAHWFNDLQRISTSAENAAHLMSVTRDIDVAPLLPQVRMPTLVLHARGDERVPFDQGRLLAASIPGARFVSLESRNHILLEREPAWAEFLREVRTFLGVAGAPDASPAGALAPSTVLFTDIVSSTASTQRLGDAAAQALLRLHNAIVRSALARNGGREVKHTGDGIMASFASPSRALQAAAEMQGAFAEESDGLSVRIGVNAGEPIEEDGDLFGTTVQLARRICDHATGGQILVSDVVRQLAAGKGFAFNAAGRFVPKGLETAIDVFEVAWHE
jgi:class 3 adenylate cyclase/pimeloyl-ACP methyl ester carboxylesterase/DNA-binding winged helix-turn-helix (wHTH) protein